MHVYVPEVGEHDLPCSDLCYRHRDRSQEQLRRSHTRRSFVDCEPVSATEVDEYLRGLDEPKRSTLQALRRTILEIVPDAEQVISYRVPAFRVSGKTVAGFAAFKDHLSYLPFSGSVLGQLADELKGYTMTKSSLHFPVDRPLPKSVVRNLIAVRLGELREASR
jgi:uncharacterized protein YdhG (YjbR/CyaY superfamily)